MAWHRRAREDPDERTAGLTDFDVVAVTGDSMSPALRAGDRLLIEARSYRRRLPRVGEVVVTSDPRAPERELVKRVTAVDVDHALVELRGDAPEASTDSRVFGPVPASEVRWRVVGRYWPRPRFRGL